jgi:folate-binding protein YgfZ
MRSSPANISGMDPITNHALPGLAVLAFEGADAASFLQGQVTADLRDMPAGTSTLAGWCSPQGRVIALPRIGPVPGGFLAVLPRDLCAAVSERMRRFVMRAKLAITDRSAELAITGVCGREPGVLERIGALPSGIVTLRLPSSRELLIGSPAQLERAAAGMAPGSVEAWESRCIAEGEPEVYAHTSEYWVPQMLNLDLLGAIGFRKGCYPGQEIVARTQHLGRIKRRLLRYLVSGATLPAAGDALFLGQAKVGEVVRSACDGDVAQLLAVVNLDAAGVGLSSEDGTVTCSPEAMPYGVPEVSES